MREQDGVVKCRFFVPTSGNMKKKVGLYTLKGGIPWYMVSNASAKPEGVIVSQFEFWASNLVTDISNTIF